MSIDNRELWFRSHRFGWGWTPSKWQGWLVVGTYIGLVVVVSALHARHLLNSAAYLTCAVLLTIVLIAICWLKGEKPHWRWGGKN